MVCGMGFWRPLRVAMTEGISMTLRAAMAEQMDTTRLAGGAINF